MHRVIPVFAILCCAASFAACSTASAPEITTTPTASETPTLGPPTATAFPTFTPTPVLSTGMQIVVGGDLRVRGEPSTRGPVVKTLKDGASVQIDAAVQGENWLVGTQTWLSSMPDWTTHVVPADRRHVRVRRIRLPPAARGTLAAWTRTGGRGGST